jgi:hypothetical protein
VSKRTSIKVLVTTTILLFFTSAIVKSQDLEIVKEKRTFYVQFPDGSRVKIVKDRGCGARDVAILSPDSKYVFYTDCTGIGFESSGKDLFCCKPDGTERTFLHKVYGSADDVNWIKRNGNNYILFLEVHAGAGVATLDLFDFDNRKMLLKIEGWWKLERVEDGECFTIMGDAGEPRTGSIICLDSLLSLSDPDGYRIEVYEGWGYRNLLFLSTRREAFLNPASFWPDTPDEEMAKISYGGLGQCFPSPDKRRNAYCINLDTESWMGILNNETNRFQFSDSINGGEYKCNFAWSDDGRILAFVKSFPEDYQEIVVLEFLGDTSYVVKEDIRLEEEKEIELVGWSTRKGGFYYMVGKKEFLKIME